MKIFVTSVMVDDQQKALEFYTEKLGFVKKEDVSAGGYRWLTVTSPDGASGMELLLEPMAFPPAREYQKAVFDAGMPLTMFGVDDIDAEYKRLVALGVEFKSEPMNIGPATIALLKDTCGNWIQIAQFAGR